MKTNPHGFFFVSLMRTTSKQGVEFVGTTFLGTVFVETMFFEGVETVEMMLNIKFGQNQSSFYFFYGMVKETR